MASLSDDAQAEVNLEQHEFITDKIGCGPKLLQVIINKATDQNHGTIMELCTQIMHLQTYMTDDHC